MPARHDFDANRIRQQIIAALNMGTLEVMLQTQTELQLMVSKPGKGRLYAKTAKGVKNLSSLIGENVGLSAENAQRLATGRHMHRAFGGKGEMSMQSAIGKEATRRYQATQRFVARRVGVQASTKQIRNLTRRAGAMNLGEMDIHRASAPGDPPTVRTGTLRRSIQIARPKPSRAMTRVGWKIGVNVKYAPYLEFGTRRMKARPFVKPVMAKMKTLGVQMLRNRLRLSGLLGVRLM